MYNDNKEMAKIKETPDIKNVESSNNFARRKARKLQNRANHLFIIGMSIVVPIILILIIVIGMMYESPVPFLGFLSVGVAALIFSMSKSLAATNILKKAQEVDKRESRT